MIMATCIFPAAPTIPITINGGATMPGWFDLFDWPIGPDAKDDRARVLQGVEAVKTQIAKLEARGVAPERIVVGGFSQGGAIALNAAYRHDKKLGACVALSGWLTLKEDFSGDLGAAKGTPRNSRVRIEVTRPCSSPWPPGSVTSVPSG